ncbi:hypothetical protein bcgnr5384_56890 [Bacillus cereus]
MTMQVRFGDRFSKLILTQQIKDRIGELKNSFTTNTIATFIEREFPNVRGEFFIDKNGIVTVTLD